MPTIELKGKGAIVTGGGSGINLAFVKALYQEGCNVLISDISLHRDATTWIESLKGPISNGTTPKIAFQQTDVSEWKQLEEVFSVYEREFGGLPDLICPGAGIYEPSYPHWSFWGDQEQNDHYKVLDINLLHPIRMTRIFVRKLLKANKTGVVLHVSSTGAQKSSIVNPLYQVSKHGISSFVRGMKDLDALAGIRVVGVSPGTIRTPLWTEHPEGERFLDPEKDTLIPPEEVARGMIALVTDPKYPPGTILEVADINGNWREVFLLNDPGPQGPGSKTSKKHEAIADIKKLLEKEAGRPLGNVLSGPL